ncbi:unnamed protein product [Schistosoma bovis]|nr:unnamed protein product [Schistosoma bovis]
MNTYKRKLIPLNSFIFEYIRLHDFEKNYLPISNKHSLLSETYSNKQLIHIHNSISIEIPFSLRQYTTLYYIIIIIIIIITWLDNVKAKPSYYKSFIYTTEHNTNTNNKNKNNNHNNNDSWNMIEPWEPLKKPIENQLNQFNNDHKHNEWNNIRIQYQSHQLYLLNNNGAKCNDGSSAGYYYRPAKYTTVSRWLIFLEGGWYCFDEETCILRESNAFSLFSSKFWPKTRSFGGILSSDPNANPIYHEFHSVFIPYCSSDLWTGKMANRSGDFYFHGSRILAAVIDNIPWQNAAYTEKVIFAGSSAGGIGVLMNIDRLSRKLFNRIGYPVLVSGIIDSSWFIHIPAYQESKCVNAFECPPEEGIHRGMKFWNPRIPKPCRKAHPKEEKWKCYLAPFMYPHLKTPVYIVQSLFDEAQMQMSKVPLLTGGTYSKWAYIQNLGKEVARSLQAAGGVFAPSCLDHEILTKNNWVHKMIGTISLVNAIKSWDNELEKHWVKQKLLYFSIHYPNILLKAQQSNTNNRQESEHKESVTTGTKTTTTTTTTTTTMATNSTLIFLSRLVHLLNQYPKRYKRHLIHYNDYILLKSYPYAFTMTRLNQKNVTQLIKQYHKPRKHINSIFGHYSNSFLYHIIDSCGLFSINGNHGTYLCKNMSTHHNITYMKPFQNHTYKYIPSMDYLIPQCNPTCGYLSNPQRIKLIDILALYQVNTNLLANLLGLSITTLRNYNSEQQMHALFCNHHHHHHHHNRVKRGLSQLILPQLFI